MNLREILSKIEKEEIIVIWEEVAVQFDNLQQTPLGFQWRGEHYEVLEPLLVFKSSGGYLHYLLLTSGGVFCLTLVCDRGDLPLSESRWVLRYRVKDDAPPKKSNESVPLLGGSPKPAFSLLQGISKSMLVPLPLLNVVYYHGHLCPELAIGYRAGLVAQQELGLSRENAYNFFVLAENMTSAIDALQFMTGCTIGNQNFFVYDLGKHVYYFGRFSSTFDAQEVLRVALINPVIDLKYKGEVEKKIVAGRASATELKEYQKAIDDAVQEILSLPEEDLFSKSKVSLRLPQVTSRHNYTKCSCCGEVVAVEKSIMGENKFLCQVCAAKTI